MVKGQSTSSCTPTHNIHANSSHYSGKTLEELIPVVTLPAHHRRWQEAVQRKAVLTTAKEEDTT